MEGACSAYGRDYKCIQILVGKPEGKRPLGRTRHRREDNTEIDFMEMGREGVFHLAQRMNMWRALVNTVMNLRFP
jgi:hypothetical protein